MKRKPRITAADTGKKPRVVNPEYLRRNLLHSKAAGVEAGLNAAIKKLRGLRNRSKWIKWMLDLLVREWAKSRDVVDEMASHRDEVEVYE